MKILLTGASGFLGSYIVNELKQYEITTIGRSNADVLSDLTDEVANIPKTDLVIHAAGKAHFIPKNEADALDFFKINTDGTANLLKRLKKNDAVPQYFVFISTVSVYGINAGIEIGETHPLLAEDPYGRSKILAEQIVKKWCVQENVRCTILRLPLLIGSNPKGNFRALIKGINRGIYFNIGKGASRKSMVLASDVAQIIPHAATIGGTYNLTDGYHPSFSALSESIADKLNKKKPYHMPRRIAVFFACLGDLLGDWFPLNSLRLKKMEADLTFDDTAARQKLNWHPRRVVDNLDFS